MPQHYENHLSPRQDFAGTVSRLALGFTGMLLVSYLGGSLLIEIAAALGAQSLDLLVLLNDVAIYCLGLPVLLAVGRFLPNGAPLPLRPKRVLRPGSFVRFACIGYTGMYLANLATILVLTVVRLLLGRSPLDGAVSEMMGDLSPLGAFLLVAVLPAILEELVFRAYLYKKLIRFGEGPYILLSALFFAGYHANFEQALYAFVLGCWMAYMVCRTGTMVYGVLLHLLVNFYSANVLSGVLDSVAATALLGWVTLAVVVLGIVFWVRMRRGFYLRRAPGAGEGLPAQALFNVGMILWLLVSLSLAVYTLLV